MPNKIRRARALVLKLQRAFTKDRKVKTVKEVNKSIKILNSKGDVIGEIKNE